MPFQATASISRESFNMIDSGYNWSSVSHTHTHKHWPGCRCLSLFGQWEHTSHDWRQCSPVWQTLVWSTVRSSPITCPAKPLCWVGGLGVNCALASQSQFCQCFRWISSPHELTSLYLAHTHATEVLSSSLHGGIRTRRQPWLLCSAASC